MAYQQNLTEQYNEISESVYKKFIEENHSLIFLGTMLSVENDA